MALVQSDKAIFYHPLDDSTESLKSQAWTPSTPIFGAGKVSSAMSPTIGSASVAGTGAAYDSAAAATKSPPTASATPRRAGLCGTRPPCPAGRATTTGSRSRW